MDCRITDCKIVLKGGSIVSVPPNHFGDNERYGSYYGFIQKSLSKRQKGSCEVM